MKQLARVLRVAVTGAAAAVLMTSAAVAQRPPFRSDPHVRLWSIDDRDMFRRGEPLQILFQTSADAFVAVLRIDTRGRLELLFPVDPRDDGFVRGRLTHRVRPSRLDYWRIDEPPGIAYVFAVASAAPLDLHALRRGYDDRDYRGRGYDDRDGYGRYGYSRGIHGDPFFEIERIAELLVRDRYSYPATDVFSYYVDGRHDYPQYACHDGAVAPGLRRPTYPDCTWLRESLRRQPDYYDTRRFRGDRNFFDRIPRREDLRR